MTGLKFDLFAISRSNLATNFVFGLPEGFWPGHKGPNEVTSVLHYLILQHKSNTASASITNLVIHADNCAGQNKNRWVLWYCCWLVFSGGFKSARLLFLVAGHTKNICDSTFGLI